MKALVDRFADPIRNVARALIGSESTLVAILSRPRTR
jgi:hypothetical protein